MCAFIFMIYLFYFFSGVQPSLEGGLSCKNHSTVFSLRPVVGASCVGLDLRGVLFHVFVRLLQINRSSPNIFKSSCAVRTLA